MPKVDTSTMDPRTHVALADGRPLLRAIPKRYLCTLAQECGSQAALADKLSGRRTTVHRQDLNGWINGTKHMSNLSVIHVSHVLGVSPLCVLDLCGPNETEAPNETATRDALTTKLQTLCEWQRTGSMPTRLPYAYPKSQNELAEELAGIVGDYRDLERLVVDVAAYYAGTCDPKKLGGLIARITEAGRAYRL